MNRFYWLPVMMLLAWPLRGQDHRTFLPHFTNRAGVWETHVSLHNPTLTTRNLRILAYDHEGRPGGDVSLALAASATHAVSITELFSGENPERGWLEIRSDSPQITGLVRFTSIPGGGATSLPLILEGQRHLVFPGLDHRPNWHHGFAITNLTDEPNPLVLEALNAAGERVAVETLTLAAHAKQVTMVTDFFEAPLEQVAVVRVSAAAEIGGIALSFSGSNQQIVAVPAKSWQPGEGNEAVGEALQALIDGVLRENEMIPGLTLRVESPSSGLSWHGASGLVDPLQDAPLSAQHPFRLASVTKTVVASLALLLAEEDLLDIDRPAADYLPAGKLDGLLVIEGQDYSDRITVKQLLNHSSGLPYAAFDIDNDGNDVGDLFERVFAQPEELWTFDKLLAYVKENGSAVGLPGAGYHYSNFGYVLLGAVLEGAGGEPLHRMLRERIFDELGMENTWLEFAEPGRSALPVAHCLIGETDFTGHQSWSIAGAGGNLISTTNDLALFMKALNNGGLFQDPESMDMMTTYIDAGEDGYYGLGLNLFAVGNGLTLLGHDGFTGSFMIYWLERDLYVIGTSNQVAYEYWDLMALVFEKLGYL